MDATLELDFYSEHALHLTAVQIVGTLVEMSAVHCECMYCCVPIRRSAHSNIAQ